MSCLSGSIPFSPDSFGNQYGNSFTLHNLFVYSFRLWLIKGGTVEHTNTEFLSVHIRRKGWDKEIKEWAMHIHERKLFKEKRTVRSTAPRVSVILKCSRNNRQCICWGGRDRGQWASRQRRQRLKIWYRLQGFCFCVRLKVMSTF